MTKQEAKDELKEIQQLMQLHDSGTIQIGTKAMSRLVLWENKLIIHSKN